VGSAARGDAAPGWKGSSRIAEGVGYRGRFRILVPSTNAVVEHDVHLVRPRGVTFHAGRMYIERPSMATDAVVEDFLQQIRDSLRSAVRAGGGAAQRWMGRRSRRSYR
jgi:hypothetical protein